MRPCPPCARLRSVPVSHSRAAEQRRASELIAKAVIAIGGAAKLDGIRTLKIHRTFGADQNPSERTVYVRFPDEIRADDKARFESYGVATANDAFQVAVSLKRVFPMPPPAAAFPYSDIQPERL